MKTFVNSNNNTTNTMAAVNSGLQKVLDFINKKEKTEEDAKAVAEFVCKPLPGRPAVTKFSDAIFDGMYMDGICKSGLEKVEFWKELTAPSTKTRKKMQNLGWELVWEVEKNLGMADLCIEKMSGDELAQLVIDLAKKGDHLNANMLILGTALDLEMLEKSTGYSFNELYEEAKTEAHLLDNSELGYGTDNWD